MTLAQMAKDVGITFTLTPTAAGELYLTAVFTIEQWAKLEEFVNDQREEGELITWKGRK